MEKKKLYENVACILMSKYGPKVSYTTDKHIEDRLSLSLYFN